MAFVIPAEVPPTDDLVIIGPPGLITTSSNFFSSGSSFTKSQAAFSAHVLLLSYGAQTSGGDQSSSLTHTIPLLWNS